MNLLNNQYKMILVKRLSKEPLYLGYYSFLFVREWYVMRQFTVFLRVNI